MKKHNYFIWIALFGMGCSNVVEVDVASRKPRAVLNAIFTPDSTWRVSLTESNDVLSERYNYQPISDALVTIQNEKGEAIETLTFSLATFDYKGNLLPQEDESYSIIAEIKGEKFSAVSKVPKVVLITSVTVDTLDANLPYADVGIKFTDPPAEKNFYIIKILEKGYNVYTYNGNNDTSFYERPIFFSPLDPKYQESSNDGLFDGNNPNNTSTNAVFFDDTFFNGQEYTFRLRTTGGGNNATSTKLVLMSASEDYYRYYTTKKIQDNGDLDPFSQPAQVYSNIKNGVGIFAGYGVSIYEFE